MPHSYKTREGERESDKAKDLLVYHFLSGGEGGGSDEIESIVDHIVAAALAECRAVIQLAMEDVIE